MKVRQIKKRFWWTWHFTPRPYSYSKMYGWFAWGVGRCKVLAYRKDKMVEGVKLEQAGANADKTVLWRWMETTA